MKTCRVVELYTSKGVLSVELYEKEAPREAEAFMRLAMSGQLDGDTFHTLIPGCALVGTAGAASGRGTFGMLDAPCRQKKETPVLRHVGAGLLSCPIAEGTVLASTFIVTLSPQPQLDEAYTVFGRIYKGMSLLRDLSIAQVRDDFELVTPLTVKQCTVTNLPAADRPSVEEASAKTSEEVALVPLCHVVRRVANSAWSCLVSEE
ncbi:peptidylprolyl isomerase [Strigomonas culicis]|uniref:Peptidyl-prolyl cis-trans isomerase n=1 Tax=Strigomonas culicis TaxID=28005 RepID=S9U4K7_9TRYP|nr:peptidylprolyl isomerase [Strigomonas culicis]EPY33797.1 peptidylprolyl isomerase [Strigomonas culicis]|eukprot:EPY23704.1 peptidylprolyl isomerase [Strigomonas culicis]